MSTISRANICLVRFTAVVAKVHTCRYVAELVEGQDVKISGFGNFEIRSKSGRPGRNPRTGEPVPIPPKRVVTFRASAMLKDQINKSSDTSEAIPIDTRLISK